MKRYKQLTQAQRYHIDALRKTSHSQTEIAQALGVNKSTICRELKRNRGYRGYRPQQAQKLAETRRYNAKKAIKMTRCLKRLIESAKH